MPESLVLAPTDDPGLFRTSDGRLLRAPEGWICLAPGDAGLTRRVKAAGPSWQVVERRGRKLFSRGLWAPAETITAERAKLEAERATPEHARRRLAESARRGKTEQAYALDFANAVLRFLRFSPRHAALARHLAVRVAEHATPVGSGTVARTQRIPIEKRAEAAVVAWMRHQTTGYDELVIRRVKGARRQVRRELASFSRAILDLHRVDAPHDREACPLCRAIPLDATGS